MEMNITNKFCYKKLFLSMELQLPLEVFEQLVTEYKLVNVVPTQKYGHIMLKLWPELSL